MANQVQGSVNGTQGVDIIDGLERIITYAKPIARLTPNKIDDAVVALLEAVIAGRAKIVDVDQ